MSPFVYVLVAYVLVAGILIGTILHMLWRGHKAIKAQRRVQEMMLRHEMNRTFRELQRLDTEGQHGESGTP